MPKEQSKIDNLEKLSTQDEEKQNKTTKQYVSDTTMRKQTQITLIRYEPPYKQSKVETNRTSFECGQGTQNVNTQHKQYYTHMLEI